MTIKNKIKWIHVTGDMSGTTVKCPEGSFIVYMHGAWLSGKQATGQNLILSGIAQYSIIEIPKT